MINHEQTYPYGHYMIKRITEARQQKLEQEAKAFWEFYDKRDEDAKFANTVLMDVEEEAADPMLSVENTDEEYEPLWQYRNNRQVRSDDRCNHYIPFLDMQDGRAKPGQCQLCSEFIIIELGEEQMIAEQRSLEADIVTSLEYCVSVV